jgi:general stress protein CsbA
VNYAPRSIDLGYFVTDWLVFFLVVSLVSGLILKMALGIEL